MAGWLAIQREARKKENENDEEKSTFLPIVNETINNGISTTDSFSSFEDKLSNKRFSSYRKKLSTSWKFIIGLIVLTTFYQFGRFFVRHEHLQDNFKSLLLDSSIDMNIEEAYHQRLSHIHKVSLSDETELHAKYNMHGGIPTYDEYRSRLLNIYQRFFSPILKDVQDQQTERDPYQILENVEFHLKPFESQSISRNFPKIISSSAKDKNKIINEFKSWKDKNPDWRIDLFDDDDAKNFIDKIFTNLEKLPRKTIEKPSFSSSKNLSFLQILEEMPKNIMKVDTFRYFKVFFDGGLYVDSDTGCRKPIEEWPGINHFDEKIPEENDFVLQFLNKLGLGDQPQLSKGESVKQKSLNALKNLYKSIDYENLTKGLYSTKRKQEQIEIMRFWNKPSLVIALEEDSFLAKEDWIAMTFARPIQITQWAFMTQAFHPVFLDALGTIMERTERFIEQKSKNEKDSDEGINKVLDWTGPGMLTDAIFRYLGAIYGIHPNQMMYKYKGVRLGDTLIYPHASFRAFDVLDKDADSAVIDHHHLHEWW